MKRQEGKIGRYSKVISVNSDPVTAIGGHSPVNSCWNMLLDAPSALAVLLSQPLGGQDVMRVVLAGIETSVHASS